MSDRPKCRYCDAVRTRVRDESAYCFDHDPRRIAWHRLDTRTLERLPTWRNLAGDPEDR